MALYVVSGAFSGLRKDERNYTLHYCDKKNGNGNCVLCGATL